MKFLKIFIKSQKISNVGYFFLMISIENFWSFSSSIIYISSYFKQFNKNIDYSITHSLFTLDYIFWILPFYQGTKFFENICSFKNVCLFINFSMNLSLFISSYIENFYLFSIFFSIVPGYLKGLLLCLLIKFLFANNKKEKNFIQIFSFLNFLSNIIGIIYFHFFSYLFLNFSNYNPDFRENNAFYYENLNLIEKFPDFLKIMALMNILISSFGILLISTKEKQIKIINDNYDSGDIQMETLKEKLVQQKVSKLNNNNIIKIFDKKKSEKISGNNNDEEDNEEDIFKFDKFNSNHKNKKIVFQIDEFALDEQVESREFNSIK